MVTKNKHPVFQGVSSFDLDVRRDADAVEFKERAIRAGNTILESWQLQSTLNLEWSTGNQSYGWKGNAASGDDDSRYDQEESTSQFWVNWLRRYVDFMVARLLDGRLTWRVKPKTGQLDDIMLARVLDRVLPHWWQQLRLDNSESLYLALVQVIVTGIAFAAPRWDLVEQDEEVIPYREVEAGVDKYARDKAGQEGKDEGPSDKPDADELLEQWLRSERPDVEIDRVSRNDNGDILVRHGQMRVDWLSGFNVLEDFSATRWQDKEWVMLRREVSVGALIEHYPRMADQIRSAAAEQAKLRRESGRDKLAGADKEIHEGAEVFTTWFKASKRNPRGWFNHILGDLVLDSGPNPYDHQQIPVIRIIERPDPANQRPCPLFSDLRLIQAGINELDLRMLNWVQAIAQPGWWAHENSIDQDKVGRNLNAVDWVFNGHEFPKAKELQPMPAHVIHQHATMVEEFKEHGGLTNPSVGKPSPQSKTATGTMALIERADLGLVNITRAFTTAIVEISHHVLSMHAQFVPKDKTINIIGDYGEREAVVLDGSKLVRGKTGAQMRRAPQFDVSVELAPKPGADEVLARVDMLLERRVLEPEAHRSVILEALNNQDMGVLDIDREDREQAAAEEQSVKLLHDEIAEGRLDDKPEETMKNFYLSVRFRQSQNHAVHFLSHRRFINRMGGRLRFGLVDMMEQHNLEHSQEMERVMQQRAETATGQQGRRARMPRQAIAGALGGNRQGATQR